MAQAGSSECRQLSCSLRMARHSSPGVKSTSSSLNAHASPTRSPVHLSNQTTSRSAGGEPHSRSAASSSGRKKSFGRCSSVGATTARIGLFAGRPAASVSNPARSRYEKKLRRAQIRARTVARRGRCPVCSSHEVSHLDRNRSTSKVVTSPMLPSAHSRNARTACTYFVRVPSALPCRTSADSYAVRISSTRTSDRRNNVSTS